MAAGSLLLPSVRRRAIDEEEQPRHPPIFGIEGGLSMQQREAEAKDVVVGDRAWRNTTTTLELPRHPKGLAIRDNNDLHSYFLPPETDIGTGDPTRHRASLSARARGNELSYDTAWYATRP